MPCSPAGGHAAHKGHGRTISSSAEACNSPSPARARAVACRVWNPGELETALAFGTFGTRPAVQASARTGAREGQVQRQTPTSPDHRGFAQPTEWSPNLERHPEPTACSGCEAAEEFRRPIGKRIVSEHRQGDGSDVVPRTEHGRLAEQQQVTSRQVVRVQRGVVPRCPLARDAPMRAVDICCRQRQLDQRMQLRSTERSQEPPQAVALNRFPLQPAAHVEGLYRMPPPQQFHQQYAAIQSSAGENRNCCGLADTAARSDRKLLRFVRLRRCSCSHAFRRPPSTKYTPPVDNSASVIRKRTMRATSCGEPSRFSSVRCTSSFRSSSV